MNSLSVLKVISISCYRCNPGIGSVFSRLYFDFYLIKVNLPHAESGVDISVFTIDLCSGVINFNYSIFLTLLVRSVPINLGVD